MSAFDLRAWCALLRAPKLSNRKFLDLLSVFGTPEAFFKADAKALSTLLPHADQALLRSWQEALQNPDVEQDLNWLSQGENRFILPLFDVRYPAILKTINDPPALLFVMGEVEVLNSAQIAVVGSRNATAGGEKMAYHLARGLAQAGFVINSGLALGIDGVGHRAALDIGAKTVAVVGTGLDRVYPKAHHQLAHQVVKQGAMVSEFPIGVGVRGHHFLQRNRVIAGMSLGVVVAEAKERSGSLATARMALEAGREVFAVPGAVNSPYNQGCHGLIKQGAKLTDSVQDILEEFAHLSLKLPCTKQEDETLPVDKAKDSLNGEEGRKALLLERMAYEVHTPDGLILDEVLMQEGFKVAEVSAFLTLLELEGLVQSLPGGKYQRL